MVIVSLNGSAGSGKSTVGRLLATALGIPFFSMGDMRRAYALEHHMTIAELNELALRDSTSDRLVDEFQRSLPDKHASFVIDGRVSYYFLPQSFKVYLQVPKPVGAARIQNQQRSSEHWASVEDGVRALEERERTDKQRYRLLYNADPYDLSQYDLIIDAANPTPEQIAETILSELRRRDLIG